MTELEQTLHTAAAEARRIWKSESVHVNLDSKIQQSQAFKDAVAELNSDPASQPRFSKPAAGLGGGISALTPHDLVWRVIRSTMTLPDDDRFESTATENIRLLLRLTRDGRATARVRVVLDPFAVDELPLKIGPFTFESAPTDEDGFSKGAIIIVRDEESRVWEDLGKNTDDKTNALMDEAAQFVDLIKLVTDRRVYVCGLSVGGLFPFGGGTGRPFSPPFAMPGGARLDEDAIKQLRDLYPRVVAASKYVKIALKRLGVSRSEFDADERVLNLMTAAEALFLAGGNTESKHKLAIRGAIFIDAGVAKSAVARTLGDAYDVRSKVAHGDDPASKKVKRHLLDGTEASNNRWGFAEQVDQLVVKAIRKALTDGLPMNDEWNPIIFNEPAPT